MGDEIIFPDINTLDGTDLLADVQTLFDSKYSLALDCMWLVQTGVLVFMMHLGFMTLEAGSVQLKNKDNIIFKNFITVAFSAITYYFWGFGISFGDDQGNRFIGLDRLAPEIGNLDGSVSLLTDPDTSVPTAYGQALFFFQWAFAATAATIVSGAVAGRMKLEAYMLTAVWVTSFVYPIVVHSVWATTGWLSAFTDTTTLAPLLGSVYPYACGMFDFAGSGVVHLTGGVAAFWGAYFLGPRVDYLEAQAHNLALVFMGTMFLWLGWYGFNCGSTLAFDGIKTGKVAVTTTLSPAAAVVTGMFFERFRKGKWDLVTACNCALAGLVGITANCPFVDDWAAVVIGTISALLYIYSAEIIKKIGIDDPVGAISVHGTCGIWGLLATAIFATPQGVKALYDNDCVASYTDMYTSAYVKNAEGEVGTYVFQNLGGYQFAIQLIGCLFIIAWVSGTTIPLFFVLKKLNVLRVSNEDELRGLDVSEHGGAVAPSEKTTILEKP